jgi:hypothetical protein
MTTFQMATNTENKQYYLITNVVANHHTEAEIDLHAENWKLPYTIDDSDLTFDGKPLNMLYEENRWMAEQHVSAASHDQSSRSNEKSKSSRGRSRNKK